MSTIENENAGHDFSQFVLILLNLFFDNKTYVLKMLYCLKQSKLCLLQKTI